MTGPRRSSAPMNRSGTVKEAIFMRISQIGIIGALAALLALPASAQTTQTTPTKPSPAVTAPAAKPSSTLVDINSASADELDALPGIGKARGNAIIKGRPYNGKDDLLNRHILTESVYNGIKNK